MVFTVYPMKSHRTGKVDCFYLEAEGKYPERYELYGNEWEGVQVPFVGY